LPQLLVFLCAYSVQLLKNGYKIDSTKQLQIVPSIKGITLGWSLGAMLFEATLIQAAILENATKIVIVPSSPSVQSPVQSPVQPSVQPTFPSPAPSPEPIYVPQIPVQEPIGIPTEAFIFPPLFLVVCVVGITVYCTNKMKRRNQYLLIGTTKK